MDSVNVLILLDTEQNGTDEGSTKNFLSTNGVTIKETIKLNTVKEERGSETKNWSAHATAISKLVEQLKSLATTQSYHFYISGKALLPVFTLFGYHLSSWFKSAVSFVTLPHLHYTAFLSPVIPSPLPQDSDRSQVVFTKRDGLGNINPSDCYVVVFIALGQALQQDTITQFMKDYQMPLANVVHVNTNEGTGFTLTATNFPSVIAELNDILLKQLPQKYPNAIKKGVVICLAVPTVLAFAIGTMLSSTVVNNFTLTNYTHPKYSLAYTLPPSFRPPLSQSPEDKLARNQLFTTLQQAVTFVQEKVKKLHLPPSMSEEERDAFLQHVTRLEVMPLSETSEFFLCTEQGRMTISDNLLEPLRVKSLPHPERFFKLLFLHEVYHAQQSLTSWNYQGVGRAGVVLEHIDYFADAVSVGILISSEIERDGQEATENVSNIVEKYISAVLDGIEIFDRAEHGNEIKRLAERRLRRYLVWSLQLARGKTIRKAEDVWKLLLDEVFVELAPLEGSLDEKHDKIITVFNQSSELFIGCKGKLMRQPSAVNFNSSALLSAICKFNRDSVSPLMLKVATDFKLQLLPWS